jgi:hypothetical protein
MLEARAARVAASHAGRRRALAHLARALTIDPGAVLAEVRQSLPALGGRARASLAARGAATMGRR